MRFDVNDGFSQRAVKNVYVDGELQRCVFWADTLLGEVERAKLDKDGKPLCSEGGQIVREAVIGCVGVSLTNNWDVQNGRFYYRGVEVASET